jgi:hypothetical protein
MWKLHGYLLLASETREKLYIVTANLISISNKRPFDRTRQSASPNITFAPTFAKALNVSPSRNKFIVSFPNEENVVKPPSRPTKIKAPGLRCERAARFCNLGEKADHETPNEVDCQRSIRKVNTFAERLSPCAENVTGNRTSAPPMATYITDKSEGMGNFT